RRDVNARREERACACVSEIVKAAALREPCGIAERRPHPPVEVRPSQGGALPIREHESLWVWEDCSEPLAVALEGRHGPPGERDLAPAGGRLALGELAITRAALLDQLTPDVHDTLAQIDVAPAQTEDLASAQTVKHCEDDDGFVLASRGRSK